MLHSSFKHLRTFIALVGSLILSQSLTQASDSQPRLVNLALHRPYSITATLPDIPNALDELKHYPDSKGKELTDGSFGPDGQLGEFTHPAWTGFRHQDRRIITVDLQRKAKVYSIRVEACQRTPAGVYFPEWMGAATSLDGRSWSSRVRASTKIPLTRTEWLRQNFIMKLPKPQEARYVQVEVPIGLWVFVDEIQIMGTSRKALSPAGSQLDFIVEKRKGLFTAPPAVGWMKPGISQTAGTRHIMLVCVHGNKTIKSNLDTSYFTPMVSYVDERQEPVDSFIDSYLFIPIEYTANDGRSFANREKPSNLEDWTCYLDEVFHPQYQLSALEKTVEQVKSKIGKPERVKVIVAMPYPSRNMTDFGIFPGGSKSLNFSDPTLGEVSRRQAAAWFMDEVERRWKQADYKHMELVGFYWLGEDADPLEQIAIQNFNKEVHQRGYHSFWIPYYHARGFRHWKELGFDVAMMQPNESFESTRPEQAGIRLKATAALAKEAGLGLEMETAYDMTKPDVRAKYLAYLDWGRKLGYMDDAVISYFQSIDVLVQCSRSDKPEVRNIYDETYWFVKGLPNTKNRRQPSE